jgi:hypothetical protein
MMPNQNPRIALTVPKDLNDILQRLSDLQEIPKTKIIIELLTAYQPILEETLSALEKIHKDKENAQKIVKEFGQNLLLDASVMLGNISKEVKDL